jgi:3-phenylpropionate/cinnamic acid dioxygenase small subunit
MTTKEAAAGVSGSHAVTPDLQFEIEQFLYAEADLLDRRRFHDWHALMTDDIHYWMPVRFNRLRRELDHEYSRPDEVAHFDEDNQSLLLRIKRLDTGRAWAEDPPSRTRHMVTNVRASATENPDEFQSACCFFLYRSRLERQVDLFVGGREDLLRRADNSYGFQIARRTIYLDQTVVMANNMSVFF